MRQNLLAGLPATHYHRYVTEGTNPWNAYLLQRLAEERSELHGIRLRVLDVGMGTGHILMDLAVRPDFAMCDLVGLDIDHDMVAHARSEATRRGLGSRLRLLQADVHDIPLADGQIDIVFGRSVVHHWADPVGAFGEIFRVLSRNGRVVIHEPLSDPASDALAAFNADRSALGVEPMSTSEKYTIDQITDQVKEAGVHGRVEITRGSGPAALGCEIYIVKTGQVS